MHSGSAWNWPPVWTPAVTGDEILRGEIGILKKVSPKNTAGHKFSLIIEHENTCYFCSLFFDDLMFGHAIYTIAEQHIGRSISELGGFDLSYTL